MAIPIQNYSPLIKQNGFVTTVHTSTGAAGTSPGVPNSGQTFLFDSATGITYTLPAPSTGLEYSFVVTTTPTSGSHKIITDAATTFLLGVVTSGSVGGAALQFQGNGTTHVAVTMNGTTTGGLVGTSIRFKCVTATQWEVVGQNVNSAAALTPFATS